MVKVKVIKLPDGVPEDDKYIKLGQVYEAFELRDEECDDNFYKHFYALNIGVGVFHIKPEDVEVIEETKETPDELDAFKMFAERKKLNQTFTTMPKHKRNFLMVEDGSVNEDELKSQDIPYIVYRQGAQPPFILEI